MKEVKCFWCKEKSAKEIMEVEEKKTGKHNANGTEKVTRKYFHVDCHSKFMQDKEFKKKELEELDTLYKYLTKLHNIEILDGRMLEKIQDLRNGTVKINNRKMTKYKSGVKYSKMLQTYEYIDNQVQYIIHNKTFETKWNEFAYVFSVVINKLNEVQAMLKSKEKEDSLQKVIVKKNIGIQEDLTTKKMIKKKNDELDISSFL